MSDRGQDSRPPLDAATEAAAAKWLVLHDRGLTPAEQDAFLHWLSSSPLHRESFERHRSMWSDFDRLSQWRPEHSAEPNPDLLAKHRLRRWGRWLAPFAMAAAVAIALFVQTRPLPVPYEPQVVAFEAADYRQETLPDGSVVDLNAGARAVVAFDGKERRVQLIRGEAQFTVAKDPSKPFVVDVGDVRVRAVGTAFNLKRTVSDIEVLVTEGVVHIERPASAGEGGETAEDTVVVAALTAGQRTTLASQSQHVVAPAVTNATAAEIERMLDWKPRLLDFDSTPLSEVIGVFNQRNRLKIVLEDSSFEDMPIVASIRSDNIEGFVRLLEVTNGFAAERTTPTMIVLRRAR